MRTKRNLAAVALAMVLALPVAAAGLSLADAKARGLVGEQYDGYLGVVDSSSGEVRALVDDVNARRRAEYRRIAESNQVDVGDVEALAGKKAIERTASGGFVKGPDDRWRRK